MLVLVLVVDVRVLLLVKVMISCCEWCECTGHLIVFSCNDGRVNFVQVGGIGGTG